MTTIKLSGRQKDVDTIIKLLEHIEYLGDVGASRNILVRVDGDGSGRIKVYNEAGLPMNADNTRYNIEETTKRSIVGIYDIG